MANGFAAKDATGATVEVASIAVTVGGVAGQAQANVIVDSANNNLLGIDTNGYVNVRTAPRVPTILSGNQTLTISTSVVTLTVPTGATHAFISCETNHIRFWEDGTAPTSTNGVMLLAGESLELAISANTKFIRQGAADAVLQVSYRKYV